MVAYFLYIMIHREITGCRSHESNGTEDVVKFCYIKIWIFMVPDHLEEINFFLKYDF